MATRLKLMAPKLSRLEHRQHPVRSTDEVFVPRRIRDMTEENRRRVFRESEPWQLEAWCQRERDRCSVPSIEGLSYYYFQYGSIEPPVGGPIPPEHWEFQRAVLTDFLEHPVNVVLKSRRLGLSWLALHLASWLSIFAPFGNNARIPIVCKNDDDAKVLLARIWRLHERLPTYLRPAYLVDNVRTLVIAGTGAEIRSLPATPRAARLETASLVILDEFAFPENGAAEGIWTAILPTIEGGGSLICISTGNGRSGDGYTFSKVWDMAATRQGGLHGIFLPWRVRPGRDDDWYQRERAKYTDLDLFMAEFPETEDEALAGAASPTVYSHRGIAAALALGELLDRYRLSRLLDGVEIATDWGDFQTFTSYASPLGGGGVWVADEKVQLRTEPVRATRALLEHAPATIDAGIISSATDASPAGTNRTYADLLRSYQREQPDAYPDHNTRWPFATVKDGGADRRGINTMAYLETLFENSAELWERIKGQPEPEAVRMLDRAVAIIAISPRCRVLVHQLRELRRDPETGKIKKPTYSASDPLAGDHGPDSLIALCAERAARFRASIAGAA